MNILEQIYETTFNKIIFHERKITIDYKNTIIKGPPKSGKTYLIYDYLSKYERSQYLYIDFLDYKNEKSEIEKNLEEFIKVNKIEVLIFENFSFNIKIPKNLESVIITTTMDNQLEGFETVFVGGLDFEEYLLFDVKHQNSSSSFNSFLKYGNFPEIIDYPESKKMTRNLEICKLYCIDLVQLKILFLLIKNTGEKKSIFQLFNSLKKEMKISKDRFYSTCEILEQNKVIYFCEKFGQPKAVKKIFIHNHALVDIVSYNKNFNNMFKNMLYNELCNRYSKISYLDDVDFYISEEHEIVLAIPFFNNLLSAKVISKLIPIIENYNVKVATIVTISIEQMIFIGDIEAQIVPFSNWAVSL